MWQVALQKSRCVVWSLWQRQCRLPLLNFSCLSCVKHRTCPISAIWPLRLEQWAYIHIADPCCHLQIFAYGLSLITIAPNTEHSRMSRVVRTTLGGNRSSPSLSVYIQCWLQISPAEYLWMIVTCSSFVYAILLSRSRQQLPRSAVFLYCTFLHQEGSLTVSFGSERTVPPPALTISTKSLFSRHSAQCLAILTRFTLSCRESSTFSHVPRLVVVIQLNSSGFIIHLRRRGSCRIIPCRQRMGTD